jgi:hypothetical protein
MACRSPIKAMANDYSYSDLATSYFIVSVMLE